MSEKFDLPLLKLYVELHFVREGSWHRPPLVLKNDILHFSFQSPNVKLGSFGHVINNQWPLHSDPVSHLCFLMPSFAGQSSFSNLNSSFTNDMLTRPPHNIHFWAIKTWWRKCRKFLSNMRCLATTEKQSSLLHGRWCSAAPPQCCHFLN